jgi:integrase
MKSRIDSAAARRKLAPRREPYYMPVPDVDGAYVGFRRGPDTWVARLREDEKQVHRALGKFEDHRDAFRAAKDWIKSRQQGVLRDDVTVAEACVAYLAAMEAEKGPAAAQEARSRLQRCVIGRTPDEARRARARAVEPHGIARRPLAKLRVADLEAWRNGLLAEGLEGEARRKARASANRDTNTLLAALNYAHRAQLVASPAAWAGLRKFGDVQARKHETRPTLTSTERRALLEAAKGVEGGAIRPLLEALLLTGARPIELCRATVADYDRTGGTLTLRSFKGRSAEPRMRHVPLRALGAEALIRDLAKNKLPGAPLFTRDDGSPWRHSDWDHLVRDARGRAGLRPLTAYDLRHTFISEAMAGGVDPLTVARIVGTSVEMISRTYGQLLEDHAAKAFSNVNLL